MVRKILRFGRFCSRTRIHETTKTSFDRKTYIYVMKPIRTWLTREAAETWYVESRGWRLYGTMLYFPHLMREIIMLFLSS